MCEVVTPANLKKIDQDKAALETDLFTSSMQQLDDVLREFDLSDVSSNNTNVLSCSTDIDVDHMRREVDREMFNLNASLPRGKRSLDRGQGVTSQEDFTSSMWDEYVESILDLSK